MLHFLLFFSFLYSTQIFAAPGNASLANPSANVRPVSITCSSPDGPLTEIVDITLTGDKVLVIDTEGPYSTTYSGFIGVDGKIFLHGAGECGGGINFTIDSGLIDGSEVVGHAILTQPSNYGCDGSTSHLSCKVQ